MKNLLIIFFCFAFLVGISQTDNKNIFKTIQYTFDTAKSKPIIYYTVCSWCGGNLDDLLRLKDTIIKYRSKIELIIFLDSNLRDKPKYFNCLKEYVPDTIILINRFFPTCFKKRKEARLFAQQVNEMFSTNFKMVGPGALFASFRNSTYFLSLSGAEDLASFLESMLQ